MAAELRRSGVEVETEKGCFGEFTALIDGRKAIEVNRWWYPNPFNFGKKILALLR